MSGAQATRRTHFLQFGLIQSASACAQPLTNFLNAQSTRLQLSTARPWHYHELHNPWGPAASVFDSWGFLDLCQAPTLINEVTELLSPDVILYDTQWLPDPWETNAGGAELDADAHRCPVEPLTGLTVLLQFAAATGGESCIRYLECSHRPDGIATERERPLAQGDVLLIDARLRYRVHHSTLDKPLTFAIRYFPATSRYIRAADTAVHRALTERYPLLNYARLPLWVVHGNDRANNDFVTGFRTRAGFWTQAT